MLSYWHKKSYKLETEYKYFVVFRSKKYSTNCEIITNGFLHEKKVQLFEMYHCIIILVFTVTFDQCYASLMNKITFVLLLITNF